MPKKTAVQLVDGFNELPQLYNPSVRIGGEPNVHIHATIDSRLGTTIHEPRDPDATTVVLRMDWKDAIRLAVELSKMAEVRGINLPKGVLYRSSTH